jgi:hypothetical protein
MKELLLLVLLFVLAAGAQTSTPAVGKASVYIAPGQHYVGGWGQWKATSSKKADALGVNTADIQCFQSLSVCFEASATLSGKIPYASLSSYQIVKWDENGLIAEDDSPICVVNRLLVNFQDKSIISTASPKKNAQGIPLSHGNACQYSDHVVTYNLVFPEQAEQK